MHENINVLVFSYLGLLPRELHGGSGDVVVLDVGGRPRDVEDVEVEAALVGADLVDQLDGDLAAVASPAVDHVERRDGEDGRHGRPLVRHQRRALVVPVDVGVGRPDVLHVHGVVVARLHVDLLQGRDDLGGEVAGAGLDEAAGLSREGLSGRVVGDDPELVPLVLDELDGPALVEIALNLAIGVKKCR